MDKKTSGKEKYVKSLEGLPEKLSQENSRTTKNVIKAQRIVSQAQTAKDKK